MLAERLVAEGHAVRGTTRDVDHVEAIEAAGAEAVVADPDRVATLVGTLHQVTVTVILLGSAVGTAAELEALHGSRLDMLLTKLIDTTVRGVVYESAGEVPAEVLRAGAERVNAYARRSHASCSLLEADPGAPASWLEAAERAIAKSLNG